MLVPLVPFTAPRSTAAVGSQSLLQIGPTCLSPRNYFLFSRFNLSKIPIAFSTDLLYGTQIESLIQLLFFFKWFSRRFLVHDSW